MPVIPTGTPWYVGVFIVIIFLLSTTVVKAVHEWRRERAMGPVSVETATISNIKDANEILKETLEEMRTEIDDMRAHMKKQQTEHDDRIDKLNAQVEELRQEMYRLRREADDYSLALLEAASWIESEVVKFKDCPQFSTVSQLPISMVRYINREVTDLINKR